MKISSKVSNRISAHLAYLVVAAVGAGALFAAASAQAAVTIGQLAPANPEAYCIVGPYESLSTTPTTAAIYTVPAPGGVITSWSTNATAGAGQTLEFKVFKQIEAGHSYLVVAHDGPRAIVPSVLNTFKVSIPVQAGDLISLNDLNATEVPNACAFKDGTTDMEGYERGSLADGATMTVEGTEEGVRPNVTATVLPPPAITGISPAGGSISGGTSVAISGANFAEVKSVSFGASPATSLSAGSEGQITATAPPSLAPGPLSVSVTTVAGTATSPQQFTYTACVVPKLNGKKLKAAKKALARAECKLGKVKKLKGATTKTGKVKSQSPKPGKVLTPGAKVSVTIK